MLLHEFIAQKLVDRHERENSKVQPCHACGESVFPDEWVLVEGFRAHPGECADDVRRERAW